MAGRRPACLAAMRGPAGADLLLATAALAAVLVHGAAAPRPGETRLRTGVRKVPAAALALLTQRLGARRRSRRRNSRSGPWAMRLCRGPEQAPSSPGRRPSEQGIWPLPRDVYARQACCRPVLGLRCRRAPQRPRPGRCAHVVLIAAMAPAALPLPPGHGLLVAGAGLYPLSDAMLAVGRFLFRRRRAVPARALGAGHVAGQALIPAAAPALV